MGPLVTRYCLTVDNMQSVCKIQIDGQALKGLTMTWRNHTRYIIHVNNARESWTAMFFFARMQYAEKNLDVNKIDSNIDEKLLYVVFDGPAFDIVSVFVANNAHI